MKINQFAVIPSNIRYDKFLSDKSKLLWGEIAAASNTYGICEEDNNYFANAVNADTRTVVRCFAQLIDNGHLIRLYEKNKRKLKVVFRSLPIPEDTTLRVDKEVNADVEIAFANNLIETWEATLKTEVPEKESVITIIRRKLKDFTEQELLYAIKNRAIYLSHSEWHRENKEWAYDILLVLEDDNAITKLLTLNETK